MNKPENNHAFNKTLLAGAPPLAWPEALQALWWDAKGNWQEAHNIAQDINSIGGYWIHAYLHRKDGDTWNAAYWYRRAGRPMADTTFEEELQELVAWVLKQ